MQQRRFFAWFIMMVLGCLFGALSPAVAQDNLPPDGTRIIRIEITGLERVAEHEVARVMELKENQPFMAESFRRDREAVYRLGYFDPLRSEFTAEKTDEGAVVRIKLTENPIVDRISIVGNLKYDEERLKRELDFGEGDILPLGARGTVPRSIGDFYADGGYKTTEVRLEVNPADEPGHVDVLINIDEGEKIRIKDLIIRGNHHFCDITLKMLAVNSGSWLFFNNYYDDRAFADDLGAMEAKYHRDGYLDATARPGEFIYDAKEAWVSPVVIITEGPRYRVGEVRILGNTLFTDEEVNRPFRHVVGDYFSGIEFDEALRKLRLLYGNQGYVNAQFEPQFIKDPEKGRVSIEISITENQVVYVGQVMVEKQEYEYQFDLNPLEEFINWTSPGVSEETIRRELKLKPGEKYRTADEVRSAERLRRLGFFDTVNINRQPTRDPQVNDAVVQVKEDPGAGFFAVTAGVGEQSGPAVGFNYINPNLFGEARVLKANVTLGKSTTFFNIGYLERYIGDSEDSLALDLYRSYSRFEGYAWRKYGASAELEHPFSEYVSGAARLRVEQVRLERHDDDLRESMSSYGVVALRGMLKKDLRNSIRWPTSGYLLSGGVETGYASGAMLKFMHEFEWYKELAEDWVYMYGHRVGIQPYDADHIGISERFFIGGSSTLRGFKYHGAGPKDKGEDDVVIGGSTMLTQRHELRHRFSRVVSGRVFVDAGMLEFDALSFGKPRVGAGAGVSFNMGAIVIDIDLAGAVVKKSHDQTRVLHFQIRSAF
ncbi:BamA/TamA family outer membrane protein [bacterium]|nr:BamA/TamA family outer membrane protein [bacterium]